MITDRQQTILRALVEEYTETATPVASRAIAKKYGFSMSPATMRNEFAALEHAGLIRKPHTSGGRIPTDKGYRLYVNSSMQERRTVSPREERHLAASIEEVSDADERFAQVIARALAELSAEAALIADAADTFSYSGLTHLIAKPEFESTDRLALLARAIDHMDEFFPALFADAAHDPVVLIGEENPLSNDCSVVMSRYAHGDTEGLIAIVGPTRMHYDTNIRLIHTTVRLIEAHDRHKHRTTK